MNTITVQLLKKTDTYNLYRIKKSSKLLPTALRSISIPEDQDQLNTLELALQKYADKVLILENGIKEDGTLQVEKTGRRIFGEIQETELD